MKPESNKAQGKSDGKTENELHNKEGRRTSTSKATTTTHHKINLINRGTNERTNAKHEGTDKVFE
jgi:hypothetical protein